MVVIPTRMLRRALVITAAVAVIAATGLGAVGWIGSERAIHPGRKVEDYQLSQFDLPAEEVRFTSRDGLTLAGWFIPGSNGAAIILAHGYGHSRAQLLPHADYLWRAGFSVLLFDFRNRGDSEGDTVTIGAKEALDIEGAVDYLEARRDVDPTRIGVQGVSLGAASAILAAAETPQIRGVVAESAFKSVSSTIDVSFEHFIGLPSFPFAPITEFIIGLRLGVDADDVVPANVIGEISPRPVFLIHDIVDDLITSDSGQVLYEAAGEPKELWQVPGAEHTKGWQQAREDYERRALAFWRRALGIGVEAALSSSTGERTPTRSGQ
jgi:fermentation-respiration switch protein FrsA (DUF1100 family)